GGSVMGVNTGTWVAAPASKLAGSQPALANKGFKTSCGDAWDCEYDQYCASPVTNAACAHDKCAAGAALSATCGDACVAAVCAAQSSCCTTAWTAACVQQVHDTCGLTCTNTTPGCLHDICTSGGALSDDCDNASPGSSCVHQVCNTPGLASCCTT